MKNYSSRIQRYKGEPFETSTHQLLLLPLTLWIDAIHILW